MAYRVQMSRRAQRTLRGLPDELRHRMEQSLASLGLNPRPPGCIKLSCGELWQVRIGVHRVLYEIDDNDQRVDVLNIGHRRDVYRSLN